MKCLLIIIIAGSYTAHFRIKQSSNITSLTQHTKKHMLKMHVHETGSYSDHTLNDTLHNYENSNVQYVL